MQFDIFHSLGRVDNIGSPITDREVFRGFFGQLSAAEELGYDTIWVAESHFSSEVQKNNPDAVIPNYQGELGLNCDFGQLALSILQRTQRLNFGTAIHNIVGGNGGPICSADRVRSLLFYNSLLEDPRQINIGVASGRFPYINKPFGIIPRNSSEQKLWPQYKRVIFLEAYEIFYRLLKGETLSSEMTRNYILDESFFMDSPTYKKVLGELNLQEILYEKRWNFEPLKLVPELEGSWDQNLNIVLGSHDPKARELAFELGNPDIFNLSFTPPEKLAALHEELFQYCENTDKPWHRSRLPRTVLIFIDESHRKAVERAERCFDTYIDAMMGTVQMPPRQYLMDRALIGTPSKILEDLLDFEKNGFNVDDRIMCWFEFNQNETEDIVRQMTLFSEEVMRKLL